MVAMDESVDDPRPEEPSQADASDEHGLAGPDEPDQQVSEPEPPFDNYVPV